MFFDKVEVMNMCETYLIAGQQGRGKTHTIINELSSIEPTETETTVSPVLWLTTNNVRGIKENRKKNWFLHPITNYEEFLVSLKEIKKIPVKFDAIVVDCIDDLYRFALSDARNRNKPIGILTQHDYLVTAENIIRDVRQILRATNRLFCTINIVRSSSGSLSLSVNRDFYNKFIPIFTDRWVCVSKVTKEGTDYAVIKDLHKLSEYAPN